MSKKKKKKISPKQIKRAQKQAWKDIENSGAIISKFKDIFGVKDVDNKDIVKLLKKAIKYYIKHKYVANPEEADFKKFAKKYSDNCDSNGIEVSVVKSNDKKNSDKDKYSSLF